MKTETVERSGPSRKTGPFRALALALCSAFLFAGCESRQEQAQLYAAWCKLYNRHDITITEWQMLRENYMLPGGDVKRAVDAADTAAAMAGVAAGMAAASAGSK